MYQHKYHLRTKPFCKNANRGICINEYSFDIWMSQRKSIRDKFLCYDCMKRRKLELKNANLQNQTHKRE